MSTAVVVRAATAEDADAVAGLERSCLGPDAWSDALVAEAVGGGVPLLAVLVAEEDDAVVGYAAVSVAEDAAELQRVAVDRPHRRRGVAGALLDAAEGAARDGGAERLLLEVRVDNAAAVALYRGRGYADLGRRERYYRDGAPALVLSLPLAMMAP